jgi:serine/threonine-protein kinase
VTPSNVFVTYDGRVKVIDFAIASASLRDDETRMGGIVKGSIGYMSPEAVRREHVDRRADIFSVGVMLWEAATGRRLWQGHDEIAVFRRLTEGDLPIQTLHAEGTCADMLRIAARALAVDPSRRYATAEEMRVEIEGVLTRLGDTTHVAPLAAYMQTFFSVDRQQLRTVVDEAAAALRSPPPVSRVTTSPLASSETFRTTSTSYDIVEPVRELPKIRRHMRQAIVVACVTGAAAMGIAYAAHTPNGAPARTTNASLAEELAPPAALQAAPAPMATAEPAPAAPSPACGTISAVFLVRPAHARIFLDGAPLEGNPAGLRRRPDDKPHLLRIEAPGYATLVRAVDLDHDVAKEFELAPEGTSGITAPRGAPSTELRDEPSKSQPAKRAAVREDPWGI